MPYFTKVCSTGLDPDKSNFYNSIQSIFSSPNSQTQLKEGISYFKCGTISSVDISHSIHYWTKSFLKFLFPSSELFPTNDVKTERTV